MNNQFFQAAPIGYQYSSEIAQVLPANPPPMTANILQSFSPVISQPNWGIKRQKFSEDADFTQIVNQIPASKASQRAIAVSTPPKEVVSVAPPVAEKQTLVNTIPEWSIILPTISKAGIKSVSASITTNYAQKLNEKETEIKQLEAYEESKVAVTEVKDLDIKIQRSIFKGFDPLFHDKESKMIRWFCANSYPCDEIKLIKCTNCNRQQHIDWVELQKDLKPYIWVYWQFLLMDLMSVPVSIISEPIKLTDSEPKSVKITMKKEIVEILNNKKNQKNYKVEIRGLRLNDVPFKNAWPNFGDMSLNGSTWQYTLTLPEREQSRKRKDDPIELTPYFKNPNIVSHNLILKKKKTPPNQKKNEDKFKYVIGIYLVYMLDIPQIVNYHKMYELESFLNTYNMISERLFPSQDNDIHIVSDEIKIPIRCPITMSEVKIPARGYQCTHVEVSKWIILLNFY